MNSQRILTQSALITLLNIVSRGIGFLLPILLAVLFGASPAADAYYLASTIPIFFIQIVSTTLSTVFVPIFSEQLVNTPETVNDAIGLALTVIIAISLTLIALLALTLPVLLPRLLATTPPHAQQLTTQLTLRLLPLLLFSPLAGLLTAVLNTKQRYIGPILAPGVRGLVVIVVMLLGQHRWGIFAVVYGMVAGELLALLAMGVAGWRIGVRFRPIFTHQPAVYKALRLSGPMLIGMIVVSTNPLIDQLMAAPLGAGSVALLNFTDKIIIIPSTLLTTGLFVVLLTNWSELAARNERHTLQQQVEQAIGWVALLILPMSAYLVLMRQPIVQFFYGRGAFSAESVTLTAHLLGILALGLPPFMIALVLNRLFVAMQDVTLPMVVGILNASSNLLLNLLLIRGMGLAGIALSTTVTYCLICAVSLQLVCVRSRILLSRRLFIQLAKTLGATLLFIGGVQIGKLVGPMGNPLWLLLTALLGTIIYLATLYRLQRQSLAQFVKRTS